MTGLSTSPLERERAPLTAALHRAAAVCAVAGPLAYVLGVLLHPEEQMDRAETLATVAAGPQRWALAHVLVAVSAVLLLPALLGLAGLVARSRRSSAALGAAGALAGLPALYGIVALELVLLEMAAPEAGRGEMVALAERLFASTPVTAVLFVPSVLWTLGLVVLAVAAARAGLVARWTAVVLVVAALTASVPGGATRAVGAVLLLVGMLPVAARLRTAAAGG